MKHPVVSLGLLLAACGINAAATSADSGSGVPKDKLPDWSGFGEQFETGSSGGPDDPAAANAPLDSPYNAGWRQQSKPPATPADYACITLGSPGLMLESIYMFEALITSNETAFAFDFGETRHVYTDGKPLPPQSELVPSLWGSSVGHWEGQTLVVDILATDSDLDPAGDSLSNNARFHERIRKTDKNHLEDQITITDPMSLTHLWRITRLYHRAPNMTPIVEEECQDNERDVKVNGTFTIAPPAASK